MGWGYTHDQLRNWYAVGNWGWGRCACPVGAGRRHKLRTAVTSEAPCRDVCSSKDPWASVTLLGLEPNGPHYSPPGLVCHPQHTSSSSSSSSSSSCGSQYTRVKCR